MTKNGPPTNSGGQGKDLSTFFLDSILKRVEFLKRNV